MMPRRAVFLDRDGVLNEPVIKVGLPHPPRSVADLFVYDDARTACQLLKHAGYLLICVTNQPDIARGTAFPDDVEAMNVAITDALELDALAICPHDDADSCSCRKPKPGMLIASAERFGVVLAESFMVGDRWRDIDAGQAAGCRTIFIDRGYAERQPHSMDHRSTGILDAAEWILRQNQVAGALT